MIYIEKLRKLKNTDNFIQINFKKGFQYIDTAGEVINVYADTMESYSMDGQKLLINKPIPEINELKISIADFWCHIIQDKGFSNSESRKVGKIYINNAKKILSITGVNNLTRVGWRTYHLYEFNNKITSLNKSSSSKTVELVKSLDITPDLNGRVAATLLQAKDDSDKTALLFDIDISMQNEVPLENLEGVLEDIQNAYMSHMIVDEINNIFKGV